MIIDIYRYLKKNKSQIKQSLLKALTWRLIGTADTFLLVWLITKEINSAFIVALFEVATKIILYFFHEGLWNHYAPRTNTRYKQTEQVMAKNEGNLFLQTSKVSRQQREMANQNKAFTIWFTGFSGAGKSTIAVELDSWFFKQGYRSYVIDGDNTRIGINKDLSFTKEDRGENIRRVAEICKLFNDAGIICIAAFISPFQEDRQKARTIIGADSFVETFIDTPLEICKLRDKKGLYKLAESGKLENFTGISSPFEAPTRPDIHLRVETKTVDLCVKEIVTELLNKQKIGAARIDDLSTSYLQASPR